MCPERSATSAYHRVCHADKSVRLDFMADTTSRDDDKRITVNGINSLARGHYMAPDEP